MEGSDNALTKEEAPVDGNGNQEVDSNVLAIATKFKGFSILASSKGFLTSDEASYPPDVERRLNALKKIQMDMFNMECKFFEELHELESKYSVLQESNCQKRCDIVLGKHEPTKEECEFTIPGMEEEKKDEDKKKAETEAPVTGIPKFWLTIFQNVGQLAEMMEDHDVPILEHLEDVKLDLTNEPMGFKLLFQFSPNDYFTNPVLTKSYEMRVHIDPKDPFSFEGTEIYKSSGCKINWKEGMDVTIREVKKKQKHKATGAIRMTSKIVATPSFFEFFNPPQIDENDETNTDPDLQEKLTVDFEVGSFLKERIIPRAVLYFTGEALESDDDEEEEEFTDEETEGEEESGNERLLENSATENEDEVE